MNTLSSRDGTTIAYDKHGEGPALILVDGALTVHSSGSGSELAKLLAPHFTVYGFDRRGRGESGDTLPYAVDREIDDIEALIDRAGGPAFLYGHSSGGPLAMRAALRLGGKVSKIAMYEPPYNNDPSAQESWSQYLRQLNQALAERRRGDAVALFMRFVGTPADQVARLRRAPSWPGTEAVAPTLAYDHAAILGEPWSVPTDLAARVAMPALVMAGDAGLPFMPDAARVLSRAMPRGQLRMLPGQTHEVNPGVLAPVLVEFFGSGLVPGNEGELTGLANQAPGAIPDFAVLFEEAGGDESGRKATAEPAGRRIGPDMRRELDRRRPRDRQPGVEGGGREGVDRAQQGQAVDVFGAGEPEPAPHQRPPGLVPGGEDGVLGMQPQIDPAHERGREGTARMQTDALLGRRQLRRRALDELGTPGL